MDYNLRIVPKTTTLLKKRQTQLESLNPDISITSHTYNLRKKSHRSAFISMIKPREDTERDDHHENMDLLICCLSENNLVVKGFVNESCSKLGVDWCEAWIEERYGSSGFIRFYIPGIDPCLKVNQK
jgi:hypothetical protein